MVNRVMHILANILMVVEATAVIFLIASWIRAKEERNDN